MSLFDADAEVTKYLLDSVCSYLITGVPRCCNVIYIFMFISPLFLLHFGNSEPLENKFLVFPLKIFYNLYPSFKENVFV